MDNFLNDRESFLGKPKILKQSTAKELKPILFTSAARKPAEPFMPELYGYKLTIKRGIHASTVLDGNTPIASYEGTTLVVAKKYRGLGIGTALVVDYRMNNPEIAPAQYRTKVSQHVQEKAWDIIDKKRKGLSEAEVAAVVRNEIASLLNEARANILQEEDAYDEDIEKISKIISGIINYADYKVKHRFDYTNNKNTIKPKLESQLGIYSYSQDVYEQLIHDICDFMYKLESERNMPKSFVKKDVEYFDCKLSEHWNELKNNLVQTLSKNVQNNTPSGAKNDEEVLNDEMTP